MTDDLRVAIIGCGRMGAFTPPEVRAALPPGWWPLNHADAAKSIPGLRLVAFCDSDLGRAESAATRHGGVPYQDHHAMLEEQRPDIVTIATRTEGREAIILAAVEAGVRAIHSEKPFCRNLREGGSAEAAIAERAVAFSYGATRRYMPAYRTARDIVRSGRLGALQQIQVHLGAGAIQWTHPHSVDLALFFSGDVAPYAVQASFRGEIVCADDVVDSDPVLEMGLMRFASCSALITTAPGSDVVLACEQGTISILGDGERIEIRRMSRERRGYLGEPETEIVRPEFSGLQVALIELRDALREGKLPSGNAKLALLGQRALFALVLSAIRGGAQLSPAEVPSDFTVTGRSGNLYA